jgi:hypothetical protein
MDVMARMRRQPSSAGDNPSRRKAFKKAAGITAALVAAGSVLSEVFGKPARAAVSSIVEQVGVAPAVVALTDAPTISVVASAGNDFRVTLGGSRTLDNPANPVDGQQIIFQITQGSGGSAGITWASDYEFSQEMPQPSLSTTAGQTDLAGFIYNAAIGKWLLAAFVNGFA